MSSPASKRGAKPSPITPAPGLSSASAAEPSSVRQLASAGPTGPAGQAAQAAEASARPQDTQAGPAKPASVVPRKRRASAGVPSPSAVVSTVAGSSATAPLSSPPVPGLASGGGFGSLLPAPPAKKGRTNTPWTPAEEQRLKQMRDSGQSWSEIAQSFPARTEGSVKKHWYKDMHYAEFAENESTALLAAIKEYDANRWKVIGQKVGKPAKACEQYAKEHFSGKY